MRTLFKNFKLIFTDGVRDDLDLLVTNGIITEIGQRNSDIDCEIIYGNGQYLSFGFIDIHVHGGDDFDFTDTDSDEYVKIASFHARHGTTTLFPTLAGGSFEEYSAANKALATAQKNSRIRMPGLHLEGPFINPVQCGAINPECAIAIDQTYYKRLFEECPLIKRLTVAPEFEGSGALAREMIERKLVPSIGHTDATCAEVIRAYQNGYSLMTHFYSAMPSVRRINAHRVAGAVEAGYLLDDMFVEIIADGIHLPGDLLQLIVKQKKRDKIILVTDSMRGAGQSEGETVCGGRKSGVKAIIENGVAILPDRSAFAGSVATADTLVRVMLRETDLKLHEIINMITINPATAMGISENLGTIQTGKAADFVVFDEQINIESVYISGRRL